MNVMVIMSMMKHCDSNDDDNDDDDRHNVDLDESIISINII